jgi:hypothetical protein
MADNLSHEEKTQAEIALIRLLRYFSLDVDPNKCYPKIKTLLDGGMILEDLTLLSRLFQEASDKVSFEIRQANIAQKKLHEQFLSATTVVEQQALRTKLVGAMPEWEWRLLIGESPALEKFFAAEHPLDETERKELAKQFCPIPDGDA